MQVKKPLVLTKTIAKHPKIFQIHTVINISGKDTEIILTVEISNDGEEAHQAEMEVKLPGDLYFMKEKIVSVENDIQCLVLQTGAYLLRENACFN